MQPNVLLLTGATGFLGSHIAEVFSKNEIQVLALIRTKSNLINLNEIKNSNIVLINFDDENYKEEIKKYRPTCLIHSAWAGVSVSDRNNWIIQSTNVVETARLLELANYLNIKKVIGLGSQAEYGNFSGRINEDFNCNPKTAYGTAKLSAQIMIKGFCESHGITWTWLRLFSLYGERESENWLIPSLIKKIVQGEIMDMTAGEQLYDYIYAGDFATALLKVVQSESESGIFNLTSNTSISLRAFSERIRNILNPNAIINFGALPYRPNQVMHMEGDSEKFYNKFNFVPKYNDDTFNKVLNYYKNKFSV